MWQVTISRKAKKTGATITKSAPIMFETRVIAEKYLLEECFRIEDKTTYGTAYLFHPTYGSFNCDPSYWDFLSSRNTGEFSHIVF